MKHPRTMQWRYEDYLALPDDGTRYEIVEGERFASPVHVPRHEIVSQNLNHLLLDFVRPRDLGEVLTAPCDVILANDTVVQPDLLFVSTARRPIIQERGILGAPDLCVEILSETSLEHEQRRKLDLYGRHGVRECWMLDPDLGRIAAYLIEGGKLVKRAEICGGELTSVAALPGFSAPLAKIFERR